MIGIDLRLAVGYAIGFGAAALVMRVYRRHQARKVERVWEQTRARWQAAEAKRVEEMEQYERNLDRFIREYMDGKWVAPDDDYPVYMTGPTRRRQRITHVAEMDDKDRMQG